MEGWSIFNLFGISNANSQSVTFVAIMILALLVVLCFVICSINGKRVRGLEDDTDTLPSIDELRKYLKKMKEISDEVKSDLASFEEKASELGLVTDDEAEEKDEFEPDEMPNIPTDKTMPTPPPINRIVNNITQIDGEAISKIAIVRYNAFPGVTGSISFSVAMLNAKNSGIVLTSLYGHESSNCYIREIVEGECETKLLIEEEEALHKAMAKETGFKRIANDEPVSEE